MPTKVQLVKAMVFQVVIYGFESWTLKKAERERIDAFELWCRRRLLRVPWTARRSNQSILKEVNSEYSFEGLKLKLQYFGYLIQRDDSLEKTLMLWKIEGRRRRGCPRRRRLDGITYSMNLILNKLQEMVKDRKAWHAAIHGIQKVGHNWATVLWCSVTFFFHPFYLCASYIWEYLWVFLQIYKFFLLPGWIFHLASQVRFSFTMLCFNSSIFLVCFF